MHLAGTAATVMAQKDPPDIQFDHLERPLDFQKVFYQMDMVPGELIHDPPAAGREPD